MMQKVLKGRENKSSGEKLGRWKEEEDVKKGMTVDKLLRLGAKADRKHPAVYWHTITKVPITTNNQLLSLFQRGIHLGRKERRNISIITSSQRLTQSQQFLTHKKSNPNSSFTEKHLKLNQNGF